MQLFDLPDGDRAIRAIKDPFDQTALRIPGAIGKLWHAKFLLLAESISRSSGRLAPRRVILSAGPFFNFWIAVNKTCVLQSGFFL